MRSLRKQPTEIIMRINWIHETPELLQAAASVKARYPLSVADAWIAAAAEMTHSTLVHKDPESANVEAVQEVLPLKAKKQVEAGGMKSA